MAHLHDPTEYLNRRSQAMVAAAVKTAVHALPASAAAQVDAAADANSIPALKAVVRQMAADLQVLYSTFDSLLASQGHQDQA